MDENIKEKTLEVLDELAKKEKKEKQTDRANYTRCFKMMLAEEGYIEQMENYFFDGFSYLGAKPLYQYVISQENCVDEFQKIIGGKRFQARGNANDSRRRLPFLFEFLSLGFLERNNRELLISQVINALVKWAKDSRGQYLKALNKECWKRFLVPCIQAVNLQLPNFERLGLERETKDEFVHIVAATLDQAEVDENLNVKKICTWLGIEYNHIHKPEKPVPKKPQPVLPQEPSQTENADLSAEQLKVKLEDARKQLENAVRKNKEYEQHQLTMEEEKKRREEQIAYLKEQLNDKEVKNNQLLFQIKTLQEKMEEMKQTVQTYKENYTVISGDQEGKFREFKSKLAGSLRNEYADFLEAEEMEMDADLGENMRYQLRGVFEILKKNGIDLKG